MTDHADNMDLEAGQWMTTDYIKNNTEDFVYYGSYLNRICYDTHPHHGQGVDVMKGFHVLPHFKLKARFITINLFTLEDIIILGRGSVEQKNILSQGPRFKNQWAARTDARKRAYFRLKYAFLGNYILDRLIPNNPIDVLKQHWLKLVPIIRLIPHYEEHLLQSLFRVHKRTRAGPGWVDPLTHMGEGPRSNDLLRSLRNAAHQVKFRVTTDLYRTRFFFKDLGMMLNFFHSLNNSYIHIYRCNVIIIIHVDCIPIDFRCGC